MNLDIQDIHEAIKPELIELPERIAAAMTACGRTKRAASVVLSFKIRRDREAPAVVQLIGQTKTKTPKSGAKEESDKSPAEELYRVSADEEPGQARIDD